MTPEQYAAQQAALSSAAANYVLRFGAFFQARVLSAAEWLSLLRLLFPEVSRLRDQSAALAREFYDAQRDLHHPSLPRNDTPLEGTDFGRFVKNMEPARSRMSQSGSPDDAATMLALSATREVENAGRRQIIHAVEGDSASGIVRGWARVATGRETCAWCLMLISRGPVYMAADTAGLDLSDTEAARMIAAGEDVSDHMDEWHTGCDCKVVPVFKKADWPGKAEADRALNLWTDAEKEARKLREMEPGRVHAYGKNKGKPITLNEDAINALRRRLHSDDSPMSEIAALAA